MDKRGPTTGYDNDVTLVQAQAVSDPIDIQGFIYWSLGQKNIHLKSWVGKTLDR